MKRLVYAVLLLGLAGCSSTNWFQQNAPERPVAPSSEQATPQMSQSAPPPMSPAASAAAPPGAARTGELMDCVTESCKINCSPKVKPQFRPKWCAQFKEPL